MLWCSHHAITTHNVLPAPLCADMPVSTKRWMASRH